MKKEGKEAKSPTPPATPLRKRAEEVALETAQQSPANIDGQTPAEIRVKITVAMISSILHRGTN